MKIGNFEIGHAKPPMIICEIGAAHNENIGTALRLIELAAEKGADAVKVQCFLPDTITMDSDRPEFIIDKGPWKGRRLYDLYTQAHMPRAWFPALFERAERCGIPLFASVFSIEDLHFIREFSPVAYKIASFEMVDPGLIKAVAGEYMPVVISTGMGSWRQIMAAAAAIPDSQSVFLHCLSSYPAEDEEFCLDMISEMRRHRTYVGLSDHSRDNRVSGMAIALRAVMIERHMTLTPDGPGLDDGFALSPDAFGEFCEAAKTSYLAMGYSRQRADTEYASLRRSLYVVQDVMQGQLFTSFNVRSIRPGAGLDPGRLSSVIGRRARCDIARGTPLHESMFEVSE